ncbi:Grx4 family monothiol glutaredoxin [Oceanobacter mangrovi]|uniref:Grx4 family monothiol glutaredoxin n=1 Tax=Oceanobacter mangrovi TaxID=2862510 RepID=UPI001C8E503C|nr:Grx4 family monothiol glutaredoxin [Oceanobacter mangrovi]
MNKPDFEALIRKQIADNAIILYMKGVPEAPECGFSAAAVKALGAVGAEFAYVNILANPSIRERLPKVSGWPTFPQLFIKGELIGGSDIVVNMAADGSLKTAVAEAQGASA